jgi:HK97 gp10 family phage protein
MATKVERREWLIKKINAMPAVIRTATQKALLESGEEIASLARHLAPKKSGALERSIGVTLGQYVTDNANVRGVDSGSEGHDLSVTVHAGDATAYYAQFVEFGTAPHRNGGLFKGSEHPGSTPSPFFFPAYRALKKRSKSRVSRAMNKAIKRVAAGE